MDPSFNHQSVDGKITDHKFHPAKYWYSERTFIFKPGASEPEIEEGLRKILSVLEDEVRAFVPVGLRKEHVRLYWVWPAPPKEGRVGWEYRP